MDLSKLNMELIKKYSFLEEYKNGDCIFTEGEKCNHIGIVVEGEINIVTYTFQDKEEIIAKLLPNDIFGQFIIFTKEMRTFGTAIALKKTKVLYISKENLLTLFHLDKDILNAYLEEICNQSVMIKQQNKLYAHNNIRDRIMFYIKANRVDGITPIISITNFSQILNIPRPSISRELIKLKNEGIIEYNKHYIKYLKEKDIY